MIHINPTTSLVVLIVVGAALAALSKATRRNGCYQSREQLLTPAELNFRTALAATLPPGAEIHYQVSLRALIKSDDIAARNRLGGKYADFVICDRASTKILCVVELNDRSHDRPDRQRRDAFVREALTRASIPFLEVRCARRYDTAEIQKRLRNIVSAQS